MSLKPTPDRTGLETRYTRDHEWVRLDGDIVTVGITEHAQEQLGDLVFIELPEVGREVEVGRCHRGGGEREGGIRRICATRRKGGGGEPGRGR